MYIMHRTVLGLMAQSSLSFPSERFEQDIWEASRACPHTHLSSPQLECIFSRSWTLLHLSTLQVRDILVKIWCGTCLPPSAGSVPSWSFPLRLSKTLNKGRLSHSIKEAQNTLHCVRPEAQAALPCRNPSFSLQAVPYSSINSYGEWKAIVQPFL